MRTLAIDLGTKRIGLAMSDAGGRLATPLAVLRVTDATQAVLPITRLVAQEQVQQLLVGVPLNMDESHGPAAVHAIGWGKLLAAQCGIPAVFVDERLSSFAAEQQLIERKRAGEKLTRGKKKQQLDALAAAGFLQEFLDGKLVPLHVGK